MVNELELQAIVSLIFIRCLILLALCQIKLSLVNDYNPFDIHEQLNENNLTPLRLNKGFSSNNQAEDTSQSNPVYKVVVLKKKAIQIKILGELP